ncbi:MAG: hypothetical protein HYY64_15665 [Candidatus Rokubacteria bacterium]|nr:hypothetical protein [Candidatus Rokubacteria bacterium]
MLTERAWDTLGVLQDDRPELQRLFGEYEPENLKKYLFEGHPAPAWVSRPITVSYERWGESLERWIICNSYASEGLEPPAHHEKRVLESIPAVDETESVVI